LANLGEFDMVLDNKHDQNNKENKSVSHEMCRSNLLFNNLIWLTTKEAALFLRMSIGALHTAVSRRQIRARKFRRRLYFNKDELTMLLETSQLRGGY
jgi:hypothetical protein